MVNGKIKQVNILVTPEKYLLLLTLICSTMTSSFKITKLEWEISKTIGKVKKNILGTDTIGMNTIWGHLGGKIKYNSMQLKFTPTFDTWKPLSKCNYKFVKLSNISYNKDNKHK